MKKLYFYFRILKKIFNFGIKLILNLLFEYEIIIYKFNNHN